MRRAARVGLSLAVLVSVGLAGCTAFQTGGGPETLTPAPVPTPAPSLPPGVSEAGVDPQRIETVHASRLADRSYTVRISRRVVAGQETLRAQELRRRVVATGPDRTVLTRLTFRSVPRRAFSSFEYFENDSVRALRARSAEGHSYFQGSSIPSRFGESVAGEAAAVGLLELFGDSIAVGEPGPEGVSLRGSDLQISWVTRLDVVRDPSNGTLNARLSPDGVVRSVRVRYDARTPEGHPVRVLADVRIARVGATTVDPPAWLSAVETDAPETRAAGSEGSTAGDRGP